MGRYDVAKQLSDALCQPSPLPHRLFFGSIFNAGNATFNETESWNATDTPDGFQFPTSLVFPGVPAYGAIGCASCLPGSFNSLSGELTCPLCPVGTFSATFGATSCTTCAPGSVAPYAGSSVCTACPENTMATSTGCLTCPGGTSNALPVNAGDGISAPAFGYWNGTARTSCNACGYGSSSLAGYNCAPVPAGFFGPDRMNKAPVPCPAGSYTNVTGSGYCSPCPPTMVSGPGATSCYACTTGQFVLPDQSGCASCSAGSVSFGNTTGCSTCEPGQFSPPAIGAGSLLYLRAADLAVSPSACTGAPILQWKNAAPVSTANANPSLYGMYPADTLFPVQYSDSASGQCVARFSRSCSRYSSTTNFTSLYNAESTIIIMARIVAGGVSQRVLSDVGINWLVGFWGYQWNSWVDNTGGWISTTNTPAVTNSWVMYTLTRDAAGLSTLYLFGDVLFTGTNLPGFKQPMIGGSGIYGECSDVDIGAFLVYNTALAANDVKSIAVTLSAQFASPGSLTTQCKACPGGTSAPYNGASLCETCPAGTYAPVLVSGALYGASNCTACPLGSFSAPGSTSCIPASPGKYVNPNFPSTQQGCPGGSFSLGGGYNCTLCSSGTFSTANSSSCTTCAAGKFAAANSSSCSTCAAGTFSAAGSSNCTACAAGYVAPPGSGSCTACAAGNFSASLSTCARCVPGYYSNSIASTLCTACPAGTISGSAGSTSCTACPTGRFSLAGSTNCSSCTMNGTYAASSSVLSCAPCPAGSFLTAGAATYSCTSCPANFAASSPGSAACVSCLGGGNYASNLATGSTACLSCTSGTAANPGWNAYCSNTCSTPGTYLSGGSCLYCPVNTYSIGNAQVCTACAPGTFAVSTGSSSCSAAPAGYSVAPGSAVAVACAAAVPPSSAGSSCYSTTDSPGTYAAAGAQMCTTCAMGSFAPSAASASCALCNSTCSAAYNAATPPNCYLAAVLNGTGGLKPSVYSMWGGVGWPNKWTDGWGNFAPKFANSLPFTLPATCMGNGAVSVSVASSDPNAASFVFAIPYAGACSVSAVLSATTIASPAGLDSVGSNVVTALSVTYAGGSPVSWQVYGAYLGTITQLAGLTLTNAYPVVTVVGSASTFGYAGTTNALGFPSGTFATINDDKLAANAAFVVAPQSQNFDLMGSIGTVLAVTSASIAGQSGYSPNAITKPLTSWFRTMMGSGTIMVSSPTASVYYPLTTNSVSPSIVGAVSGSIKFNGLLYTAQVYSGWAPAVTADGLVLSVSAPFAFIQLSSPVFTTWAELSTILPIPPIGGVSIPSVINAIVGWLPMPSAQMQIMGVTTSVDFSAVPAAYAPAVFSSTAGLYGIVTIGFPTGPCASGGKGMYYVGNTICSFIVNNPKVFQPKASLQLSISVNPVLSAPDSSSVTIQAALNEIQLTKKLTFTTCAIYATIEMSGNMAFGLAVAFTVNAGSDAPLVVFGSIEFSPPAPPDDPAKMTLTAGFQGYVSRAFGSPFVVLSNVQVGPIGMVPVPPYVVEFALQGTIIIYSKQAKGNPAYLPSSSPLIDLCTPGGPSGDADSENCLSVTGAMGGSYDPPNFWYLLSTNAVPISPRSLVCIVGKYCASPTSPLGILLGEAVVSGFSISSSPFLQTLLSGAVIPAGQNLFFNATIFDTLSAMANVTTQCIATICYYINVQMYAGPVNTSSQFASKFEVAAYASVLDPGDAYFFASLTIGSNNEFGLPELLCKFAKFCGLQSGFKKLASVPAQTMLNASFSLRARDLKLINGFTVRLPRGFRAAWITTICGYTASLVVSADVTGGTNDPGVLFSLAGNLGAYTSGPFKLCVSATDCSQGPFINSTFSLSTKSAEFEYVFAGYVQIYGFTTSVYGRFSQSKSRLQFAMQVWKFFSFNATYQRDFVFAPNGTAAISDGASLNLQMSADHMQQLKSLVLKSLKAAVNFAYSSVKQATNVAKKGVKSETAVCQAQANNDAAVSARECDDCSDACYDASSWTCTGCASCHSCGWRDLSKCCSSCADSCRDSLRKKCRSGCGSVCNVVNNVATALAKGECATLEAANSALSAASSAAADITKFLNSFSGGSIPGFELNNVTLFLAYNASVNLDPHISSNLYDVQARGAASITYTINKKQTTYALTVSLSVSSDIVEQFAKRLYDDVVSSSTRMAYAYTSRVNDVAMAFVPPPTPVATISSSPSVTQTPITQSASFIPSRSSSRTAKKTPTSTRTVAPSAYSTVTSTAAASITPSSSIGISPSPTPTMSTGKVLLDFREFKSSASAATCTGSQSMALWPNLAATGFALTQLAGDALPALFWDTTSSRCVARVSVSCTRGYSTDVSSLSGKPSTIVVMARMHSTSTPSSGRVLSDQAVNWFMGWWNGNQASWYSYDQGWNSQGVAIPTAMAWKIYTLTRDEKGVSIMYDLGTAINSNSNSQLGFKNPQIGGGNYAECSSADVGAFQVFNYAMTADQVSANAQTLSTLYGLPVLPASVTPSGTPASTSTPGSTPASTGTSAVTFTGTPTASTTATNSAVPTGTPSKTSAPVVPGSLMYLAASSLAATSTACTGSFTNWPNAALPLASSMRVINGPHSDACANLAEVRAVDAAGKNWALSANGGTATASSDAFTLVPSYAIDGDYNSMWHSSCVESAWIQVTFAQPVSIASVAVFARQDCCQFRNVNDVVQLLDVNGVVFWSTTIGAFSATAPYMWQTSLAMVASTDAAPTKYWDAASGQCVGRFAASCSRLTSSFTGLYNASSTVSVLARIASGGVSRRVLADSSSSFALGWWGGNGACCV